MNERERFEARLRNGQALLRKAGLDRPFAGIERLVRKCGFLIPPVLFMSGNKLFAFVFTFFICCLLPVYVVVSLFIEGAGAVWPYIALLPILTAGFAALLLSLYFRHLRVEHGLPNWESIPESPQP